MTELTTKEKIEKLESVLGPYESWDETTEEKLSDNEELLELFDIKVSSILLLERENPIFGRILYDSNVGFRIYAGYEFSKAVMEADPIQQKKILAIYTAEDDPIYNVFLEMIKMETEETYTYDKEKLKENILAVKKIFCCLFSNESRKLLYLLISQFEELFVSITGEENIVAEVQLDFYDQAVSRLNQELLESFKRENSEEEGDADET